MNKWNSAWILFRERETYRLHSLLFINQFDHQAPASLNSLLVLSSCLVKYNHVRNYANSLVVAAAFDLIGEWLKYLQSYPG